jgi:hypothetical protein
VVRRLCTGAVVALLALAGVVLPVPVEAARWSHFGGDGGRSGHQAIDGGVTPVAPLWGRTDPGTVNAITPIITTGGPPGQERVAYGTGDHRGPDGDIIGGRLHLRTLAGGDPVTPPEGIKLSDQPDAFGDGYGSVGFADASSDDAFGQVWVAYNDEKGISIVQVDEERGDIVQKRVPNPGDVNDKLANWTLNSSILIGPPDTAGNRALFINAFEDARLLRETLIKITISRPNTREAKIGNITWASGDFNFNDVISPALVYLYTNAGNAEAHVAVGDCTGKLSFFTVDDLQPIRENSIGAETDCIQAISVPVTANGLPPGAPGSGMAAAPVFYVTTTDSEGKNSRVHRVIQKTSIDFERKPDSPALLPGVASPGVAVDQTVAPEGMSDGRVYVTTGRNLYSLDAKDLTAVVARFNPGDGLTPYDTGFAQTSPLVSGDLLFVSRDNGEELVLDKRTLQPMPTGVFRAAEAARPDGGSPPSVSYGGPSLTRRTVVFGSTKGVFAYRLRSPLPPSGYWLVAADGGVFTFGDAHFAGSAAGASPGSPVVGLAATPSGRGYWVAAANGGVFSFGDARFFGSASGGRLNEPVVGIVATPTGGGYWLVAADGAVLTYGDARFFGSDGDRHPHQRVVGMAATPTGGGYWLVASDGSVFSYGDARFLGSASNLRLSNSVVGMSATPTGDGYWLVASDGGVFTFGAARFFGSMGPRRENAPVVGIATSPSGNGYTLVARDGGVFTFGDGRFYGSTGGLRIAQPIVGIAVR